MRLTVFVAGTVLYAAGVVRMWSRGGRGRGISVSRAGAGAAGWTALGVGVLSPLDEMAEGTLSAHMIQHGLLVAVAPLLVLLGKPLAAVAWSFPPWFRKSRLARGFSRNLAGLAGKISRPLPAALLHGVVLWSWHAPFLFEAALRNPALHALEHVSFFGTALLFWHAILRARSSRRAAPALAASFATLMHSGLLGGLITMAPYPLYAWYQIRVAGVGWSALEDQQLAGLIMWIPLGVVYLGACLVLAGRLVTAREPSPEFNPVPVTAGSSSPSGSR